MPRQQVWMEEDEFDLIVKNSQRMLRLNDQNENHPYVEEFTNECNVMLYMDIRFRGGGRCRILFW